MAFKRWHWAAETRPINFCRYKDIEIRYCHSLRAAYNYWDMMAEMFGGLPELYSCLCTAPHSDVLSSLKVMQLYMPSVILQPFKYRRI
jgi:hypothetical protein